MARKFLVSLDLNQNELLNARIQNLATAPSSPLEGQIYYDSSVGDKSIYFWDGSTWVDVGGDLRSIVAGMGISVTGTRDITVNTVYDDSSIGVNGSNQLYVKAGGITNAMLVNSSLTVTAGSGLSGGGTISLGGSATLNIGAGTGITVNADSVQLDTASTRNTDHASVVLTAGAGLTGGGDITASRTFDVGAGTGITVNADNVAITGAGSLNTNAVVKWNGSGFSNSTITDDGTTVIIGGNLTVNGTVTYINSTTLEIGDNIIVLNKNETGTPSMNAGIEIERGTSPNVSFLWIESGGYWSTVDKPLQIGSIADAGGAYSGNKYLVSDNGVVKYLTAAELAIDVTGAMTFVEGNGIDISVSGSTVTISAETASTTNEGIVELATDAEANLMVDTTRAVTPSNLAALRYVTTGPLTTSTNMTITHNLNTKDIIVQVYEIATGDTVECDCIRTSLTQMTLMFAQPVTANTLRILLIKVA
jgi:hypothetical protein